MDFFFNPEGIAIVGATPNPLKGGNAILKNLKAGFRGGIYPVNPRYDEIEGLPCFSSVRSIPNPVDVALIFVPAKMVPAVLEDCIRKGVKGVIIESGGFAETGEEGAQLQRAVKNIATQAGIRVWGPNCMGLVDLTRGYIFSFMTPEALPKGLQKGNISLIVQSGLLSAGFLIDIMSHHIARFSKVCSIGNKIDVNECDLMPYLLKDEDTKVVGMYLESFTDGRGFAELCRRSQKPIVLLYGGKSRKGAEAAITHTASLAGNSRVISGVMAQVGVIEAVDFKHMIDICRAVASYGFFPDRPGRVAILTYSGGAGIVSADFIEQYGLSVADLSSTTRANLKKLFPDWMPVANPVDLWPALEKHAGSDIDVFGCALDAVLDDDAVDAVLLHTYTGNIRIQTSIPRIAEATKKSGKPTFVWLLGKQELALDFKREALSHGIPVFDEISRAVECMAVLFTHRKAPEWDTYSQDKTRGEEPPCAEIDHLLSNHEGTLDEHLSKTILRLHGIPTVEERIVRSVEECMSTAKEFGFPVVLKGLLPGAVHKTERGLICLGISTPDIAHNCYLELIQKVAIHGKVLLQKQLRGSVELMAGLIKDPLFGTCIMLGVGGFMAELFRDTVFAMAPLTERDALLLIGQLKNQKLLEGYRGEPPVNRRALAEILIKLGNFGLDHPRISEIDINPLMNTPDGLIAVDATIVLTGKQQ